MMVDGESRLRLDKKTSFTKERDDRNFARSSRGAGRRGNSVSPSFIGQRGLPDEDEGDSHLGLTLGQAFH